MKLLKRIHSNHKHTNGVSFPEQELENINRCMEEQFTLLYPISLEDKAFQTYGHIFSNEILLIITLVDTKSGSLPITFFISKDMEIEQIDDSKKAKKTLDNMVELAGIFFDEVLSNIEWNNYILAWTEEDYKGQTYYIKTSRENIELTLQANQLLGDDFDDNYNENIELEKEQLH